MMDDVKSLGECSHFKYSTLGCKDSAMTRHQFGRLRLPDKIVLPSQCPMSSPGAFFHAWRPIGRQDCDDGGQCGPQDRPIADGEAESRMAPCGVSKWRLVAIEFYGVPWHLCCVYGLRDTTV